MFNVTNLNSKVLRSHGLPFSRRDPGNEFFSGAQAISCPESSGSLASVWSPEETSLAKEHEDSGYEIGAHFYGLLDPYNPCLFKYGLVTPLFPSRSF